MSNPATFWQDTWASLSIALIHALEMRRPPYSNFHPLGPSHGRAATADLAIIGHPPNAMPRKLHHA